MAKYSFEFNLKIVQEYLEGKGGATYLSKKYGVQSDSQVKNWLNTIENTAKKDFFVNVKIKFILFNSSWMQ